MQRRPRVATSESSFAHITHDHVTLAPSVTAYQDLARDARHAHQSTWARGPWLTWRALRPGVTTRTRVSAVARAGVGEHRALTPNRAQLPRRERDCCYSRPAWRTGHAGPPPPSPPPYCCLDAEPHGTARRRAASTPSSCRRLLARQRCAGGRRLGRGRYPGAPGGPRRPSAPTGPMSPSSPTPPSSPASPREPTGRCHTT